MFDTKYQNQVFIAEHGSWDRSTPIGYRISLVTLDQNHQSTRYTSFACGWLDNTDGSFFRRPVDIELLPDGSMLLSDDFAHVIYRIFK